MLLLRGKIPERGVFRAYGKCFIFSRGVLQVQNDLALIYSKFGLMPRGFAMITTSVFSVFGLPW